MINGTETPEDAAEKLQKGLDSWYKPAKQQDRPRDRPVSPAGRRLAPCKVSQHGREPSPEPAGRRSGRDIDCRPLAPPAARVPLAYRRVPCAGGARLYGVMILPLADTLQLSLFTQRRASTRSSSASTISAPCSATRAGRRSSGTRWGTMSGSSSSTCWCRTRSASRSPHSCPCPKLRLARLLPHGDLPADHAVLRHRRLHLEADPVAALGRRTPTCSALVGLKCLFAPWLGKEGTR